MLSNDETEMKLLLWRETSCSPVTGLLWALLIPHLSVRGLYRYSREYRQQAEGSAFILRDEPRKSTLARWTAPSILIKKGSLNFEVR